jgi:hypothetical protein
VLHLQDHLCFFLRVVYAFNVSHEHLKHTRLTSTRVELLILYKEKVAERKEKAEMKEKEDPALTDAE